MAVNYPINPGTFQNPYREFLIVGANGTDLQPNESVVIAYDHRMFRVLDLSASAEVTLRFGNTGAITSIIGAGLGMKHNEAIRNVTITNIGAGAVTGRVALSMGDIFDDRLSVSGTVTVTPAAGACFGVRNCEEDEVPVPLATKHAEISAWNVAQISVGTSAVQIAAANANRDSITVQAGTAPLIVGDDNTVTATSGVIIPANGSHTFTHPFDLYAIRASATANCSTSEEEI